MRLRWFASKRFAPCYGSHDKFNMVEGLSRRFPAAGYLEALFQAMFTRASAAYRRMFSICNQRVASHRTMVVVHRSTRPIDRRHLVRALALIPEHHRLPARHVTYLHPMRPQIGVSRSCHQRHTGIGCQSMFDEQQLAGRFEYAPHFCNRRNRPGLYARCRWSRLCRRSDRRGRWILPSPR